MIEPKVKVITLLWTKSFSYGLHMPIPQDVSWSLEFRAQDSEAIDAHQKKSSTKAVNSRVKVTNCPIPFELIFWLYLGGHKARIILRGFGPLGFWSRVMGFLLNFWSFFRYCSGRRNMVVNGRIQGNTTVYMWSNYDRISPYRIRRNTAIYGDKKRSYTVMSWTFTVVYDCIRARNSRPRWAKIK